MKKIIIIISLIIISFFISISEVNAATVNFEVNSNKTSVVIGNSITVVVNVSSSTPMGALGFTLNYDHSKFSLTSSNDLAIIDYLTNASGISNKSYTYTFKAITKGTGTFSLTSLSAGDISGDNALDTASKSKAVSVIEPVINNVVYSKNNYLSALSIEGYNLEFNKETLEYSLLLPNETKTIKINATVEDTKARISGIGNINVSEGINKIQIKVIAENGNERIYTINATVKELNSVTVKINNKEYTIIRKEGIIEAPSISYTKTTTKINNEDILSYYSEITKYTLIGLKDSEGNSNYYIYDNKNDSYTLYKEYNFNGIILNIQNINKNILPSNYKETTIDLKDDKVIGYKINYNNVKGTYALEDNNANDFYLLYALNVNTGKSNLYSYDKEENTVQRYNNEEIEYYKEKSDTYFVYILILLGVIGLIIIICSIILIKKPKRRNIK